VDVQVASNVIDGNKARQFAAFRGVDLSLVFAQRQHTTNAMMSLGSDARLRTPSLRSLNCLPQSRHRNRR
jgi:hypothetical protein